jgi:hypothetical protein
VKITLVRTTVDGNHAQSGGGIATFDGEATLTDNSRLTGNTAAFFGGGLESLSGKVTVVDSIVDHNSANSRGGGLYLQGAGEAQLVRSTVQSNVAGHLGGGDSSLDGRGGGVFTKERVMIDHSTISNNIATQRGGGIGTDDGVVKVVNSTVSGNAATDVGGGIDGRAVDVQFSTVSGNASNFGGGIRASTVQLLNATISGNTANGGGGVVAVFGSIMNSTIVENTAANNAGGVLWASIGISQLHVKNTIIANNHLSNTTSRVGQDVSGNFVSDGHNLIGVVDGGNGFGFHVFEPSSFVGHIPPLPSNGDLLGSADNPLDPKLGALADNGGPTKTHALLAGSPAIDHGDNGGAPATDQRGVARPRDGDGNGSLVVDIGAFER